jgi:hypothetical protein
MLRLGIKPSEIYWLLRDLDNEGLLWLMVTARKSISGAVSRYVLICDVRPLLGGQDCSNSVCGPARVSSLLNQLLEAQLNSRSAARKSAYADAAAALRKRGGFDVQSSRQTSESCLWTSKALTNE